MRALQQAFQLPRLGTLKHFRPKIGSRTHHRPPPTFTHGVHTRAWGNTPPSSQAAMAAVKFIDRSAGRD